MKRSTKWIAGAAIAATVIAGGTGIALATTAGDDDKPLTGNTLERARTAALEATGGGTVTETETGDDGATYGVEVQSADGSQVEVNLDGEFNVVGRQADDDSDEGLDDADGPDDADDRDDADDDAGEQDDDADDVGDREDDRGDIDDD
jgi:hypothetical protein